MQQDRTKLQEPITPESLPAVVPPPPERKAERRFSRKLVVLLLILIGGAIGGGTWWFYPRDVLPPGIAFGNGRLEADEIDIDTKYAGRIARLLADEGDLVKGGQVVALMDTRDLQASLEKSAALVRQASRSLDEARANLAQQETQVVLAQQELDRAKALVPEGFETREVLDQRQQAMDAAVAGRNAATERIAEAQFAMDAATHDVQLYQVEIADNSLFAPRDARIQYRVANVGEVLPAGGKVFTVLDTNYVYMDIYLPTAEAGRVKLGSDARIVLDAYPGIPLPASVTFLASQAQFTPKDVETKDERDKLMFRVRVRIDPDVLSAHQADVRSGLPGLAYVRTDPAMTWPAKLQPGAAK